MWKLATVFIFVILISLSSCAAPVPGEPQELPTPADAVAARQTLLDFFQLLSDGDYPRAASLYSGSYDWLIGNNPDVSPSDHSALLERGCLFNGLQCLEVRSAVLATTSGPSEFVFTVEFTLPDGSLFIQGPCCGATETEQPPLSQFQYGVVKLTDGSFRVTDLPVYVP